MIVVLSPASQQYQTALSASPQMRVMLPLLLQLLLSWVGLFPA
jgi:hypothetical protein